MGTFSDKFCQHTSCAWSILPLNMDHSRRDAMHQDQRIGLALGVLLVGACAAFFFRNETRMVSNAPRLQHAQELDDRIAELSTRPYLKGIEDIEAADRQHTRTVGHGPSLAGLDDDHEGSWSPVEAYQGKTPREPLAGNRRPRAKLLDPEADTQELAPIPIPSENGSAGNRIHGTESAASTRTSARPQGAGSDGRMHVVQKGETLSSIAAKMLGNPNRFHEIFDANHDQLRDANDLKPGMTLVIPDARAESASKPMISKGRSSLEKGAPVAEPHPTPIDSLNQAEPPVFSGELTAPVTDTHEQPSIMLPPELPNDSRPEISIELPSNEESTPAKKFVPARRMPPPGRPAGPQAKMNTGRDVAGRRLSQVPLEATSGKVAR
jgi:hypothetical protein